MNILTILYILINLSYTDTIWYHSMDTGTGWEGYGSLTSSYSTTNCNSAACVHLSNNGKIQYHDISTVNYHNIQLQYSISVLDFEDTFDTCQVFYSIDTINWIQLAKYNYTHDRHKYVEIKNMNKNADNIKTLSIKFQSNTTFNDYCYIDEVYVLGQLGTRLPTEYPTVEPTYEPTTEPTYDFTVEPTYVPSNNPIVEIKNTVMVNMGHGSGEQDEHNEMTTDVIDMDNTQQNIDDNIIHSDSFLSAKYLLYQITLGIMISLCLLCIIIICCIRKNKSNNNKNNTIIIKVENSYNDKDRIMTRSMSPKVIHIRHSTDEDFENIEMQQMGIVSDPSIQINDPSTTNGYINRNPFIMNMYAYDSSNKQLMIDTHINVISIMTNTSEGSHGTCGEIDMNLYDITPPHHEEDDDDDAMYDNITSEEDKMDNGETKGNTIGCNTPYGDDENIYGYYDEDNDTPLEGSKQLYELNVNVNIEENDIDNDDVFETNQGDVTPQ